MFDADRAVEVISRGGAVGVENGYGSGYYLGGGVVLTCAHVLSEAAGVKLTVRDLKGAEVGAQIAWCNRDHDVAVLSVDDDGHLPQERVPLCVLPRVTTDEVTKFVMYGWPKAGQVGSKRNPVQVHGPIKLAEIAGAKTGTVRLRPGEGSPPPQHWKGMSGAAVFCRGHLIAVQIMHPNPELDYLEGRLLTEDVWTRPDEHSQSGSDVLARAGIAWDVTITDLDHSAPTALVRPQQLPHDTAMFTGRTVEVKRLLALASNPQSGSAVVISAIDGMAGIGKTALVVHVGHQIAGRFPDGQMFRDLHGFTTGIAPVEPDDALDRLLRDVGVPGERIPAGLDERAALWRSLLAGRRMLILLDNAANEAQVEPLLPGTASCLVLVTSRRRLAALEVSHTLSLDTLPEADAVILFTRTADRLEVAAEASELVEVIELCGRLPLAIRIAASRLKHRRAWTVADLVARLRDADQRLSELDDGQRSVTAALELSYKYLPAAGKRLYRLLGLHPGHDIEPYAAAALTATTLAKARRLLDRLVDDHLLQEPTTGRYVFHDLVRTHAAGVASREETEPDRRAALSRLLDHYRHTASVAMDTAHPYERERRPTVPPTGAPTPDLADPSQANGWLDTELPNLLAVARYAAESGRPEHLWHLSTTLHRHLRTRGRYRDAETLHHQALTTARTTGHRAGELDALNGLGHVHRLQGRHEQAADHYGQVLEIARAIGNLAGELDALHGLGHIHHVQGRYERAADHYGQALEIARSTGNRAGELDALGGLGHIHLMQGRHEQAADHLGRVLEIARAIGNRGGELDALTGLGWVHRWRGRHEQAADHFGRVLEIARTTGHRVGELNALNGLGHVHRLQGRHEQAADHYRQVLDLAQEIGNRNWQLEALQGLGRLHHATGHPELALDHHRQALQLATDLSQSADQARAHDGLAHAYHTLNQHEQARQHWQHTLDILTSIGTDHTEDEEANIPTIRVHLTNLDG